MVLKRERHQTVLIKLLLLLYIYVEGRCVRVSNETAILAIQIAEIATLILSGEKKTFI